MQFRASNQVHQPESGWRWPRSLCMSLLHSNRLMVSIEYPSRFFNKTNSIWLGLRWVEKASGVPTNVRYPRSCQESNYCKISVTIPGILLIFLSFAPCFNNASNGSHAIEHDTTFDALRDWLMWFPILFCATSLQSTTYLCRVAVL